MKAFGRNDHELIFARLKLFDNFFSRFARDRGGNEVDAGYTLRFHCALLILNERNQRRNHDAHARLKENGKLKAERFARARRQNPDCVLAAQNIFYNRQLPRAEVVVPEKIFQQKFKARVVLVREFVFNRLGGGKLEIIFGRKIIRANVKHVWCVEIFVAVSVSSEHAKIQREGISVVRRRNFQRGQFDFDFGELRDVFNPKSQILVSRRQQLREIFHVGVHDFNFKLSFARGDNSFAQAKQKRRLQTHDGIVLNTQIVGGNFQRGAIKIHHFTLTQSVKKARHDIFEARRLVVNFRSIYPLDGYAFIPQSFVAEFVFIFLFGCVVARAVNLEDEFHLRKIKIDLLSVKISVRGQDVGEVGFGQNQIPHERIFAQIFFKQLVVKSPRRKNAGRDVALNIVPSDFRLVDEKNFFSGRRLAQDRL